MVATRRREQYVRSNLEAALLIQAEPAAYGGPDSGLCQWAALFLRRHQQEQAEQRTRNARQHELFGEAA